MTESEHTQLEEDLAAMTHYSGPATELWRRAIEASPSTPSSSIRFRDWLDHMTAAKWQWLQVAALLIIGCGILWIALGQSLSRARTAATGTVASSANTDRYRYKSSPQLDLSGMTVDKGVRDRATGRAFVELTGGLGSRKNVDGWIAEKATKNIETPIGDEAEPRQVVRKAAVELHTRDVRAAFVKVQMLVSEAGGEYIEQSAISGQDEQMQADLTLRISASRMSEILNALRDIGEVISQQLSGEDVTAQAVDIEARLSNERRVEAELLGLLESRKDADLKDVLELRRNIGQVREQIERLVAQQQHLSHLVSLATVLVIIRHEGQPEPEPEHTGIGAYFARVMGNAWESGITGLADSVAWIASTLLGGLIWWSIAGAALWAAWRKFQTLRARPQSEPRP